MLLLLRQISARPWKASNVDISYLLKRVILANQKAFSDYVMSLNQLVSSAKSAEPDTQQVVDELKAIIKKLRKIGEETSKVVSFIWN